LSDDFWTLRAPRLTANDEVVAVTRWMVPDRAAVRGGEAVAEVETEKATSELIAEADGTLVHAAAVGAKVPIGAPLGYVGNLAAIEAALAAPSPAGAARESGLKATARARALAAARGVDLRTVAASGETIKERDVVRALAQLGRILPPAADESHLVPAGTASAHQLRVARNLREAVAGGLFTTLAYTLDLRGPQTAIASEQQQGRTASLLTVLLFALGRTLPAFPQIISILEGEQILRHRNIDIAFVVRSLGGALQAPVLRQVDQLGLAEIARECARLTKSAMRGKLGVKDVDGACFTLSLIATPGVESFVALPVPRQTAILSLGAERRQIETTPQGIVSRPIATATLTYDHAMCDGLTAAEFCAALDRNLNAM
jgi:pyruvate/2-oxoglutarate dehydrogenase complex dihydrolipoamide acyltransferase (E2) component